MPVFRSLPVQGQCLQRAGFLLCTHPWFNVTTGKLQGILSLLGVSLQYPGAKAGQLIFKLVLSSLLQIKDYSIRRGRCFKCAYLQA